ncbi:MAG: hypothetical protein HC822_00875 [Oscillochloris sp.]|nr:hypothetical protein [Oscillochloris sp.]
MELTTANEIFRQVSSPSYEAAAQTCLGHTFAALGEPDKAEKAYRSALALRRQLNQMHLAAEPQSGLAILSIDQGNQAAAYAWIEPVIDQVLADDLGGSDDPLRVIWSCYHLLHALSDQRAGRLLQLAETSVERRANAIDDPLLRRQFRGRTQFYRRLIASSGSH